MKKAKYYYKFKLKTLKPAVLPLIITVKAGYLFKAECKLTKVINDVGDRAFKEAHKKMEKKLKSLKGKPLDVIFTNVLSYYKLVSVKEV